MAAVSAFIAGAALYQQYQAGQDASDAAEQQAAAQRASIEAQRKIAEVDAQKARVAQLREARIRRATIMSQTGEVGGGTSGISGAASSVTSQAANNIGMIGVSQTFADQASRANQMAANASADIAKAQANASIWGTIGGTALNVYGKQQPKIPDVNNPLATNSPAPRAPTPTFTW